jgi:hypothetical protein
MVIGRKDSNAMLVIMYDIDQQKAARIGAK